MGQRIGRLCCSRQLYYKQVITEDHDSSEEEELHIDRKETMQGRKRVRGGPVSTKQSDAADTSEATKLCDIVVDEQKEDLRSGIDHKVAVMADTIERVMIAHQRHTLVEEDYCDFHRKYMLYRTCQFINEKKGSPIEAAVFCYHGRLSGTHPNTKWLVEQVINHDHAEHHVEFVDRRARMLANPWAFAMSNDEAICRTHLCSETTAFVLVVRLKQI